MITYVPGFICEVHRLVFVSFSAWFVWDLCRVQRSRGKDVRWPMELSMRMAPCPTTRSSSLRVPCATRSRSGDLVAWPLRGGGSWQIAPDDPGRSSGSWQTWPEAPGGRSSGSCKRLPAALGRRRLGGARSVGRSGRMSERWRCGRTTGSEHHGVMHCCTNGT